jgi:hypothetical protein
MMKDLEGDGRRNSSCNNNSNKIRFMADLFGELRQDTILAKA